MFTGLIEEIGTVRYIGGSSDYRAIVIAAGTVLEELKKGDSVAVEGVCLTVTAVDGTSFSAECLAETMKKTTLGALRTGSRVNLERALTPESRIGGHFVQGHIDCRGTVVRVSREGRNVHLTLRIPAESVRYVVPEGSISVNGVSLTAAGLSGDNVRVNIIPTTWEETTLSNLRPGTEVNIETDILGHYIARQNAPGSPVNTLNRKKLAAWGYIQPGQTSGKGGER